MKRILRLVVLISLLSALAHFANAQQIDVAGGMSTMFAPSGSEATGNHQAQSLDGGYYPAVGADVIFYKHIGVQGEAAWRVGKGTYAPGELNIPYRPIFWTINGIWSPKITKRISLEVVGGAGRQSTLFYSGSKYATSNHLMGDVGGGIKMYAWRRFFFRPEARLYLVNNNLEFSSGHEIRYGASIGYTFKPRK